MPLKNVCFVSPCQTTWHVDKMKCECECRSSQPAEVRLPAEYMEVIDQLGAAREKALQA